MFLPKIIDETDKKKFEDELEKAINEEGYNYLDENFSIISSNGMIHYIMLLYKIERKDGGR